MDNKTLERKFIYFPSFDAGPAGRSYRLDMRFKDGTPYRFYQDGFPKNYLHKRFLFPAAHNLKDMELRKKFQFPPGMIVFGDSGGYQIATGIMKWDLSVRERIFQWLEANSDIAMNLDIPTRGMFEGKFDEALKISSDNFKYFYENQSGKTRFLNVVQGTNHLEYKKWYDEVSQYEFQGWAIGGGRNIYRLMSGLTALIQGNEHLNNKNKVLHILGVSKVTDFLILGQLQRSMNEVGSGIQITTDSSSPSRASVYGQWYTGFNIKTEDFECVHIPRLDSIDIRKNCKFNRLPLIVPEIDNLIFDTYSLDDFMQMSSEHYAAIVLHNYSVFLNTIDFCNEFVYSDRYILNQIINPDTALLLKSIDEIIKSDVPDKIFERYLPLYTKLTLLQNNNQGVIEVKNEFFDFNSK